MAKRSHLRVHRNGVLNILLLAFVAALLLGSMFFVRSKLLQNAQSLGMALAHSYAVEEAANMSFLESNVSLAGSFIDEIVDSGGQSDEVQQWLAGYFSKLTESIGEGMVDFYAVIDGEIVAANPWNGDATYDYEATDWYRDAVAAGGQVAISSVYQDAVTGQKIITLSQMLESSGYVLAMDVYIQNSALHNTIQSLPQNASYFLCDEKGQVIYASTKFDLSEAELQSYMDYVMAGIRDGSLLRHDAFIEDMEGISRGVYYQTMRNGWTVILTLPFRSILLGEQNHVILLLAVVAMVLFIALTLLTVQDMLRSRRMKKADDTIHILGDTFFGIYRIHFRDGTYETIKRYADLENRLPDKGSYAQFMETMRQVVKPSTFQAFSESFSLEQIRRRMGQGINDYGGDYQRRFGDTYRWVNIHTLYNRELAPDEVILCFRDVEEEKRRDLQNVLLLQDALDAIQKSTKAKSTFFNSMSHDMRTPLNAIIGCCTLAEKCRGTDEAGEVWTYLQKISFASSQLLELINDILELSRLEAGKDRLNERELNLEDLLRTTAEIFRDRAAEEKKTLEISIDFRQPNVMGDEKKLRQIVNNLLSNAVKYTNAGDTIRVEARQFDFQQHSKYQILVEDTGIGMTPAFLEHLFDPYSRETTFSPRPTPGTGLGMSIVRSLVQQMSGEISVDSTLGQGTRFTVTLPLKAGQRPPAVSAPSDGAMEEGIWKDRVILAAEDNALNREIVTELLQLLGATVLTAVDGRDAVQTFQAQPVWSVDAILMDMQMPVMDGCQAAQAIRSLDRADAAGVPIVAVTANVFAEDIARTTQAGMNDHISKPIDVAALQKTLQKWLREWDAARNGQRKPPENGEDSP